MAAPTPLVHSPHKDPPQMQIVDPGKIRLYRQARRVSLRRLAQVCGCTHTAIANYENGVTRTIPEDRAKMLALILDFTLASVFRPDGAFVMPVVSSDSGMAKSA